MIFQNTLEHILEGIARSGVAFGAKTFAVLAVKGDFVEIVYRRNEVGEVSPASAPILCEREICLALGSDVRGPCRRKPVSHASWRSQRLWARIRFTCFRGGCLVGSPAFSGLKCTIRLSTSLRTSTGVSRWRDWLDGVCER